MTNVEVPVATVERSGGARGHARVCAALVCSLVAGWAPPGAERALASERDADLIVTGDVYTLAAPERVEAVAIRDGLFVFVGDRSGARKLEGPRTRVLDAAGLTILPGLIDAHAHLMNLGRLLATLDLRGAKSAADVCAAVERAREGLSAGTWIEGRGWDHTRWPGQNLPTWRDLEGTESNPVYLRRVDGHAAWVNRAVLELAGIGRGTPAPPGGRIIRDGDGNATGVLVDKAMDLVADQMPPPPRDELVRRMRAAVRECAAQGLTGVHDAHTSEEELSILGELDERGELGIRVYAMLDSEEKEFAWRQITAGPRGEPGGRIVVRAVKLYADGALGSRGALLLEPYADEPGNHGLAQHGRDELREWTLHAARNGFQPCTHAIGDAGNRVTLDVYEEVIRELGLEDHRFRLEHAQVVALQDIRRIARLGVVASMQPTHATSDMAWAEQRLGSDRIAGAYAWRKLLDAGCVIACGSDFPVEAVSPLLGLYAAVTRQDVSGSPPGGWRPEERMTIEEAVRGFTVNAAFAEFAEKSKGSIEPGRHADLTILDVDPFRAPPAKLLRARTLYTIVGGREAYRDPSRGAAADR